MTHNRADMAENEDEFKDIFPNVRHKNYAGSTRQRFSKVQTDDFTGTYQRTEYQK